MQMQAILQNWQDPIKQKRQRHQNNLRKHRQLLYRVNFRDLPESPLRRYRYSSEISPFVFFYKLLARKPQGDDEVDPYKLKLNIPDTVVYGEQDLPAMWFYTDTEGCVNRVDGFTNRQVVAKLSERAVNEELVAVIKKPSYDSEGLCGNDIKILSAGELRQMMQNMGSGRGEMLVVQRYVKAHSVKPFIVRTAWRRQSNPECWVITSNYEYDSKAEGVPEIEKLIVCTRSRLGCNFVRTTGGRFLKESLRYVENIRKFMYQKLQVEFEELVCDFIMDEADNWWFINTKAFILRQKNPKQPETKINIKQLTMYGEAEEIIARKPVERKTFEQYQKCRPCKYCEKVLPEHLMTHKLTLIMLLQADKHLLDRGKTYPWLERCFSQHIGTVNLYVEHKVCDSCYRLYKQIEKLMRLEKQYAKLLGVDVQQDSRNKVSITIVPAFKGYEPKFGSRLQKTTYQQQMPENWGFPAGGPLRVDATTSHASVMKFRMMVLIHSIQDIPIQVASDTNSIYLIQYEAFGQKVKYKLQMDDYELQPNGMISINLDKIHVFFFFAQSRKNLNKYLKTQEQLKIYISENGKRVAELGLQLNQFQSERVLKREFFKMFSGKMNSGRFPLLSWGTRVTLGFHESGELKLAHLKLHQFEGLYLHDNKDFFTCDPLPEEWVTMLKAKQERSESLHYQTRMITGLQTQSSIDRKNPKKQDTRVGAGWNLQKQAIQYSRRKIKSHKQMRKVYYV